MTVHIATEHRTLERRHAAARMRTMPKPDRTLDPVENALRAEALDTARMALCFAAGVAIDDVDPVHGYNLFRAAYDRCRASWWLFLRDDPDSEWAARKVVEARAKWLQQRPEYVQPGDWPGDQHLFQGAQS